MRRVVQHCVYRRPSQSSVDGNGSCTSGAFAIAIFAALDSDIAPQLGLRVPFFWKIIFKKYDSGLQVADTHIELFVHLVVKRAPTHTLHTE